LLPNKYSNAPKTREKKKQTERQRGVEMVKGLKETKNKR